MQVLELRLQTVRPEEARFALHVLFAEKFHRLSMIARSLNSSPVIFAPHVEVTTSQPSTEVE
jgi:hypothetical protein